MGVSVGSCCVCYIPFSDEPLSDDELCPEMKGPSSLIPLMLWWDRAYPPASSKVPLQVILSYHILSWLALSTLYFIVPSCADTNGSSGREDVWKIPCKKRRIQGVRGGRRRRDTQRGGGSERSRPGHVDVERHGAPQISTERVVRGGHRTCSGLPSGWQDKGGVQSQQDKGGVQSQ